ncbi:hypothetical protein CBS147332_8267 [Penicillium roqueforti]|nr:hypothetical protein CBS147332_8267 [Penicillium roqueforti]KAI3099939.1 hypothetical protein CBS147331_8310 [Penicillium roqueforti]KAI3141960.1 hypothetical protein CBS147326_2047 [Penicillium roqueforti]
MPEREPRQFLPQMIGEGIITYCPYSDDPVLSSFYKARQWVIVEKLDEDPYTVIPEDSDQGMGPAFTTGKFLCRRGQHRYHAFMHIYKQIPLDGTEFNRSEDRENQASDMSPVELNALKKFIENETIREKFRVAYMEILRLGYQPLEPSSLQLIYEREEDDITITGFDTAMKIDEEPYWTDNNFVIYNLVLLPSKYEKYVPKKKDIKTDKNGWRW